MRVALKIVVNDEMRYVGKIIGPTLYRNFPLSKAVLWQNKEVSMDKRAWEFIKDKVKKIVFVDEVKAEQFKVGVKEFENHIREANYGEGDQVYFPLVLLKKLKTNAKIPFVAKTYTLYET